MYELLQRCLDENDGESWNDLWLLNVDVVYYPVRGLLLEHHFNEQDAEDVVNTGMLGFLGAGRDKLRSFRGNTRGELCRWFLTVAIRDAFKWMQKHRRSARKLKSYAAESSRSTPGPTEADVRFKITELESIAGAITTGINGKDIARLRILAGLATPDELPSERTIQHWKKELSPRVAQFI